MKENDKTKSEMPQGMQNAFEPQCKTCRNIFDFPKCCTENLYDCIKIVSKCRNYEKIAADRERFALQTPD